MMSLGIVNGRPSPIAKDVAWSCAILLPAEGLGVRLGRKCCWNRSQGARVRNKARSLFSRAPIAALIIVALACVFPTVVLAFDETSLTAPPPDTPDDPYTSLAQHPDCRRCHAGWQTSGSPQCNVCHDAVGNQQLGQGPHGSYVTTSARCNVCHKVHLTPAGGMVLLPRATLRDTCMTCHDGSGGYGVYGAVQKWTGVAPGADHSIDTTNVVPGGSSATGGSAVMTFGGEGGFLTCNDCHNPHNADTVNAFIGDRQRTTLVWQKQSTRHHVLASNKLLKRRPGGALTPVSEYGSDWCLTCHKGRSSGMVVMNHPVDSLVVTATPFNYKNVAILTTDAPTGSTVLGPLGGWNRPSYGWNDPAQPYSENRGFLMPAPRTAQQAGHYPICQQCHEDSRSVGSLSVDGTTADATPFTITHEDGTAAGDNPRFQNFPHESVNARFLVERDDDLCLNCHSATQIP